LAFFFSTRSSRIPKSKNRPFDKYEGAKAHIANSVKPLNTTPAWWPIEEKKRDASDVQNKDAPLIEVAVNRQALALACPQHHSAHIHSMPLATS
jgi:hypothetical protein